MDGVYLTWLISALAVGVLLMPLIKPPWAKVTLHGFIDFLRRYWLHFGIVLTIYNAKDFLDEVDRILMANTDGMLNMTPWIYAIEGDMALWVQETFRADWLTDFMTHFYVVGFMVICYVSIFYFAYFDDRYIADRITLTIFWVYVLAIPFYLFFNVHVTGNYIPGMETLAYNHTPEINDWFHRIDPLTNGMPSLHIGFPFAVWLCLLRFDTDNRWIIYRRIVFVYVLMTAFCILYLGIHWFMDIIGGMIVAAIAVSIANKMADPMWRIFDERTINARLATVLTNPKRAYNVVLSNAKEQFSRYSKPSSKETGVMLTVVMVLVAGVITWDLTHQSIPAGGVDAPVGVAAADGWLVTLDEKLDGAIVVVHDLSDLDSEIVVVQPNLDANSTYDIKGDLLIMANQTNLVLVNMSDPYTIQTIIEVSSPSAVEFVSDDRLMVLEDGQVSYWSYDGDEMYGPTADVGDSILVFESSGDQIAMVFASDADSVHLGIIDGEGLISIPLNATAGADEDQILIDSGFNVDLLNATITNVALFEDKLAATVDINATSRLMLLDTVTGESEIISDPKYAAYDPHMGYGVLMFSAYANIDPSNASEKYSDREIYIYDIGTEILKPLTADELDQWAPMVLKDHYVYQQADEDGVISVEVQQKEPSLKPYASNILKIGVVLSIALVFVNIMQRQKEANTINHHDNEPVS
ncbi:phosphatase PAP2 family protein [Candidatus Poseidoniaceae archaeon]|nr:phosphatase PAP2 family protein [Candidatus Poseidoniaceae archaeon]